MPIEFLSQNALGSLLGEEGNPILQHSREVWAKLHKILGISQYRQEYSSIWNNQFIKNRKETFFVEILAGEEFE